MLSYSKCNKGNKTTTMFKTTLKMSTYILCWVIGDYKMLQHKVDTRMRALTYTDNVEDVR